MTEPHRSRRQVLTAAVAVAALLMAEPTALTGCTSSAPPAHDEPDPLEGPAQRADYDVALALAVASAHPVLEARAVALAADRQAHAIALRGELHRVRPSPPPVSSTPSTAPVMATADQADASAALAGAVREAQDEAAGLVAVLPGYRAALLASMAACCASHAALLA
ncbi:MAG: hypothetical protein ACT4NY_15710 [Pseudonocardiales bacterium]